MIFLIATLFVNAVLTRSSEVYPVYRQDFVSNGQPTPIPYQTYSARQDGVYRVSRQDFGNPRQQIQYPYKSDFQTIPRSDPGEVQYWYPGVVNYDYQNNYPNTILAPSVYRNVPVMPRLFVPAPSQVFKVNVDNTIPASQPSTPRPSLSSSTKSPLQDDGVLPPIPKSSIDEGEPLSALSDYSKRTASSRPVKYIPVNDDVEISEEQKDLLKSYHSTTNLVRTEKQEKSKFPPRIRRGLYDLDMFPQPDVIPQLYDVQYNSMTEITDKIEPDLLSTEDEGKMDGDTENVVVVSPLSVKLSSIDGIDFSKELILLLDEETTASASMESIQNENPTYTVSPSLIRMLYDVVHITKQEAKIPDVDYSQEIEKSDSPLPVESHSLSKTLNSVVDEEMTPSESVESIQNENSTNTASVSMMGMLFDILRNPEAGTNEADQGYSREIEKIDSVESPWSIGTYKPHWSLTNEQPDLVYSDEVTTFAKDYESLTLKDCLFMISSALDANIELTDEEVELLNVILRHVQNKRNPMTLDSGEDVADIIKKFKDNLIHSKSGENIADLLERFKEDLIHSQSGEYIAEMIDKFKKDDSVQSKSVEEITDLSEKFKQDLIHGNSREDIANILFEKFKEDPIHSKSLEKVADAFEKFREDKSGENIVNVFEKFREDEIYIKLAGKIADSFEKFKSASLDEMSEEGSHLSSAESIEIIPDSSSTVSTDSETMVFEEEPEVLLHVQRK